MNYNIFKSRTFWMQAALFVVVAGNAVVPLLPQGVEATVTAILTVLTVYFHINPSQYYNPPPSPTV